MARLLGKAGITLPPNIPKVSLLAPLEQCIFTAALDEIEFVLDNIGPGLEGSEFKLPNRPNYCQFELTKGAADSFSF